MIPSEELHQLIQSMNMSEKRYFKIHSSRHVIGNKNNYIRLFNSIEKQREYNEPQIKKTFEGETFINHLPSEKNYLYNNILESLNSFNKDKTFLARYCNILTSIEILYIKGLFDQCKKLIVKAKREAYSLEKFSILLVILRWETVIYIKDEDEKNLYKNFDEEVRILEMMRIQAAFMKLAFNIQIQIVKGGITPLFMKESERRIEQLYPKDENVSSFWTRYYYHSSRGLLFSVQNRTDERNACYKAIKKLMDEATQFIKDLPAIYQLNYNNLVGGMLMLKKYKEAEELIKQQRNFIQIFGVKNQTVQKMVFLNTNENELFLLYKTKNFAQGEAVVRKIEAEIKKVKPSFSPVLYDLLFFMAVSELMVSNYSGAIKWLNRILNAQHAIYFRKELQLNTRLLYLVILFESNDWLIENRLNSAKRIISQEPQYKMQASILEGIRILFENKPTPKNKASLKRILLEITSHKTKSNEELVNKSFDFLEWIKVKMKEQNFQ